MFTTSLVSFLLAVFALVTIPGPDMAFVMADGIAHGKRGAFASALGVSCGGLVLALLTSLLVATALTVNASMLAALQLCGALYLLYIAVLTISRRPLATGVTASAARTGSLFVSGVVTNVSNPKALVFFIAFIPQFIPVGVSSPALYTLLLGGLLCTIGGIVNFAIGITGSMLTGLNQIGFMGRSWSQWVVFALFSVVSVMFCVQIVASHL